MFEWLLSHVQQNTSRLLRNTSNTNRISDFFDEINNYYKSVLYKTIVVLETLYCLLFPEMISKKM